MPLALWHSVTYLQPSLPSQQVLWTSPEKEISRSTPPPTSAQPAPAQLAVEDVAAVLLCRHVEADEVQPRHVVHVHGRYKGGTRPVRGLDDDGEATGAVPGGNKGGTLRKSRAGHSSLSCITLAPQARALLVLLLVIPISGCVAHTDCCNSWLPHTLPPSSWAPVLQSGCPR